MIRAAVRGGIYLLIGTIAALIAFLLVGCASPAQIAAQGSAASSGLSQNLDTAHSEIDATRPRTDAVGRGHLDSADAALKSGKSKLPAINAGLAQVAPLAAKVTKLQHQFWSPRQIGLAWVVGLGALGLTATLTVLYFATPLSLPIGAIAAKLFHTLTLGIPKLFHAIVRKIEAKVARTKATTVTPTAAPTAPAASGTKPG
jgi:outer membrane murein-binding lipoprotein Lpp